MTLAWVAIRWTEMAARTCGRVARGAAAADAMGGRGSKDVRLLRQSHAPLMSNTNRGVLSSFVPPTTGLPASQLRLFLPLRKEATIMWAQFLKMLSFLHIFCRATLYTRRDVTVAKEKIRRIQLKQWQGKETDRASCFKKSANEVLQKKRILSLCQ